MLYRPVTRRVQCVRFKWAPFCLGLLQISVMFRICHASWVMSIIIAKYNCARINIQSLEIKYITINLEYDGSK